MPQPDDESDDAPGSDQEPPHLRNVDDIPRAAKMSELYIADVFVDRAGARWRYVKQWDTWYEWRRDGWYEDTTGAARGAVADMLRESMQWAPAAMLTQAGRRSLCSNGTATGVLGLAKAHPSISVPAERWDADPMMLGVPGGVVDLRTGQMRPAAPEDYITRRCAVKPKPGRPELWLAHFEWVMKGDREMIRFMQVMLGYMLTGMTIEHALVFLYGHGGNGKSVIVETIIKLMGDYGYAAPVELLMEQKQKGHPVELAMLRGKRAVSCSEPPQGSRWDDGRIRSLTGGDTMTARRMGENLSSFEATHKLIIMGNHKPTLRSVDDAIRRRFNIVNFSAQIAPERRDKYFALKLRNEWPQILNWMIEGCLHWQESGLERPESLIRTTDEYLQDEDSFGAFLTDCCTRGTEKFHPIVEVFKAYANWCEQVGERPLGRKAFRAVLFETPGLFRKPGVAPECVSGLELKPDVVSKQSGAAKRWDQD
jgi:putative DNA primase/helicase